MDFFEKNNLNPHKILKAGGVFVLGLIFLLVSFSLIGGIISSFPKSSSDKSLGFSNRNLALQESASDSMVPSVRNVAGDDGYTLPGDSEDYEITEYYSQIETGDLDGVCGAILALKQKDYVVFERSDKGDTYCNLRFKVAKENTSEVLDVLEGYKPRELNEKVQSIKKQIEDYTSEEEILKNKLQVMDDTLSGAIESYDEISALAGQTGEADVLASVIESKIKIIERLSQEKIEVSAQLDRLSRQKAEQLDKLEYTYFSVYVYENKFVDGQRIKDSWKTSIKSFVLNMNKVAQDLSVGLLSLIAYVFQYLLYLLIIVLVAKYVWKFSKTIWKK